MRAILLFLLVGLLPYGSLAQFRYGNEWIVPSQTYAKINISATGIYRVSYTELVSAGFSVDAINPKNIQLFHLGRELTIEVAGEADGRFDKDDYIEFYAKKNTGEQDSLVYYQAKRANPYQSLFSDETFYFLTIGSSGGQRIVNQATKTLSQTPEKYHLEEQLTVYTDQYSFNNSIGLLPSVQQSYYEDGEGWTGKYIVPDTVATFAVKFKNRIKTNDVQAVFEFQLNGRSLSDHRIQYTLNDTKTTDTLLLGAFSTTKMTLLLTENLIKNETITLKTQNLKLSSYDWYSMTYLKVSYPQDFLLNGQTSKYFHLLPNATNESVVQINDLGTDYLVYDITNGYQFTKPSIQTDQFFVANTTSRRTLFVSNELKKVNSISVIKFPVFNPKDYTYLIITHASLLESANQYAAYRASVAGGNYKPLVIETKAIYEQFNFGERSPIAIRRFADFMLSGGKDKYLFLLGRGISFPDILKSAEADDLVPTFGYPGSDALLTMGIAGFDAFVQAIPTGRINVTANEQALNYLNKVKEFEHTVPDDWQKHILHLNGGHDKAEILYLKSLMEQLRPVAESQYMGAQVESLSKKTFEEVESVDISQQVNAGVSMISYAGHGSSNALDFNFGYCSPPTSNIHNKGKYPIMFFNGCSINNIFYKYDPLSTDWLITPDKGAIAVLAGSFWSYPTSTQQYVSNLYQKLFTDSLNINQTLGKIQQSVNQSLSSQSSDLTLRGDMQQIILQGDPALHIFPLYKPDYVARNLFIQSRKIGTPIANDDSLNVNLVFSNVGRYITNQTVSVELKKTYSINQVMSQRILINVQSVYDTIVFPIPKELSLKKIEITVDSDARIDELNETNNQLSIDLTDWQEIQKGSVFPVHALPDKLNPVLSVLVDNKAIKNGDYVSANPVVQVSLIDENQLPIENLANIQVYLKPCDSCSFVALAPQSGSAVSPESLMATYQLSNLSAGTYELLAMGRDAAGNASGNAYDITFRVTDSLASTRWNVYPNPSYDIVQINFTVIGNVAPKSSKLLIFNINGVQVDAYTLMPFVGENSFYWEKLRLLPVGMYYAILELTWGDGRRETVKGKIIKQ